MITLPVSLGEALDKLSILDIKCRRIKSSADSRRERDILTEQLTTYLDQFAYQYGLLVRVNEEIWDMQDEIRAMSVPDGQKCIDILNKNDMRFRIKDAVNSLSKSYLREQKGYAPRRALFLGHLGLGDQIGLNGAIRYIALQHDETYVVVKQNNLAAVSAMFADTPSIKFLSVVDGYRLPGATRHEAVHYEPGDFLTVARSGFYHETPQLMDDLPSCFYRDMGLDPSIRHTYFHIPRTEAAEALYAPLQGRRYIFVQQKSSDRFTPLVTWSIDDVLTLDPNTNVYPEGHPFHALAQTYVNRPFLDYRLVLENADEIHTVDSAFYCLASYIPLKATVKRCYARETGIFIPSYTFT